MDADLSGKTVVITGASSGIGAAAARGLSARGATVVAVGRNRERVAAIGHELGVEAIVCDFAHLDGVRELAATLLDRFPRIDVMAHNAGVLIDKRTITPDGFEITMQTNYFAPFLLQHLLSERLSESRARVIFTSSIGHLGGRIHLDDLRAAKGRHPGHLGYTRSKLAANMFVRELARRTPTTGVTAVAFHPGFVKSGFGAASQGFWMKGPAAKLMFVAPSDNGARPLVHLACLDDTEIRKVNGRYFSKMRLGGDSRASRDPLLARKVWMRTEDLLGIS